MSVTTPRLLFIQSNAQTFDEEVQNFADSGLRIEGVRNLPKNLKFINRNRPDVIILEGPQSLDLVKRVRVSRDLDGISLVVIGGTGNDEEALAAFDSGADEFVTRPYSFPVLLARVKSLVRRRNSMRDPESECLTIGPLKLNLTSQEAELNQINLMLTVTEFRLLRDLVTHPNAVRTREVLRSHALSSLEVNDRTIDVHIASLRRKLGEFGEKVQTARGIGYRFILKS
jgi:DNA-binding response OmpR family regulator